MKFWKQHLTTKIATYFLLLSLITVGIVGGVTYIKARDALRYAASKRLEVAAKLKETQINRWFDLQEKDFLFVQEFPDIQAQLTIMFSLDESDPEYQAAYKKLDGYLQKIKTFKTNFKEIYILNSSHKIIISSNKEREGKYDLLANVSYIEKFRSGNKFTPIFYVSPQTGKPAVTLAKTIRNHAGKPQGIFLANLNLEQIYEIVRERTGLSTSGEKSYLVGLLRGSRKTFISKYKTSKHQNFKNITSDGINSAMKGISGAGEYLNYAGVAVLGEYRWLKDQELALLVEISKEEAFTPAAQLANAIVLISLVSAGILLTGVYCMSRQLIIYRQKSENYSQQLEAKAREAENANFAKSEFLANMSHELRTPLNSILGFAQLMKRDKMLSSEQRKYLVTINRSGEHLLSLINDVLDMSKIEAGRTVLHSEAFNLHHLLQSLQEMFQLRATAKGLFLKFYLDSALPKCIITDEGKLRQVLINLLSNAIKFTQVGGITLSAKFKVKNSKKDSLSDCLYFEVEDTGKGIASEEIDKIFDPFVQTTSGVESKGGTGLGLAISQQFVRLMGGDISVSSLLGYGSTFSFDISVSIPEMPEEKCLTKKQVVKIAPSQPDYRILIVDDRLENPELLSKLLNNVGFHTRTANNGKEAIDVWEKWEPHLIWMDMRMDIMDGYEATRWIKAKSKNKKTVIIALTASAFEEQEEAIFTAGCDDLVRKPFQEEVIFEKMSKYLGVEYIYEDENLESDNKLPDNCNIILTSEDLSVMPPEWIASLRQAALEVDADLILQIIEQIPHKYHTLAEKLRKLTLQYDFDAIIEVN